MARISSHILDSTCGDHAAGIRAVLKSIEPDRSEVLFDLVADDEGRIDQTIDSSRFADETEFELILYSADYFRSSNHRLESPQEVIVIRFRISDDQGRYHMPVMLAPHSYSTWWSRQTK